MPRSDSERLTFWLTLRDSIEDSIAAGAPVIRYRLQDGREVEREPTGAWLKEVEAIIARLTVSTGTPSGQIAENVVRFKRS